MLKNKKGLVILIVILIICIIVAGVLLGLKMIKDKNSNNQDGEEVISLGKEKVEEKKEPKINKFSVWNYT